METESGLKQLNTEFQVVTETLNRKNLNEKIVLFGGSESNDWINSE